MNEALPWHQAQWAGLIGRLRQGRLPHAILLTGPAGLGKHRFATRFAQGLLCTSPQEDGSPCGHCKACLLFQAGTHPDMLRVSPAEEGKAILVDQIRALNAELGLKSQFSGYKVAVISPAEAMNTAAANSLLKTLEEPAADTILLLASPRPSLLPATIRSRCQRVLFHEPDREMALDWLAQQVTGADPSLLLALADGAPLAALALEEAGTLEQRATLFGAFSDVAAGKADPVAVAAEWQKPDPRRALQWVHTWLMDMVRLKFAAAPPRLANPDLQKRLQAIADALDLTILYEHLDRIRDAVRLLDGQANRQLLLEDLLIAWAGATRRH